MSGVLFAEWQSHRENKAAMKAEQRAANAIAESKKEHRPETVKDTKLSEKGQSAVFDSKDGEYNPPAPFTRRRKGSNTRQALLGFLSTGKGSGLF